MGNNAPGKAHRRGISLLQITRLFPDDATAEAWFVGERWPSGVRCPFCDSENIQERPTRKPQPYRCRTCRKDFSVKTGTLMHDSKLGLRIWTIAVYLMNTNIKGVSSMKLHRDLGITQKTAWYLAHRIREAWKSGKRVFGGPVEVDETYMGGKNANKHAEKKIKNANGTVGKTAVVGMKDRKTNQVQAAVAERTNQETLQGFVNARIKSGAKVYTNEHGGYIDLSNHESVRHSVGQYVDGMASTNGMESFWALLKRGYYGTYHKMSIKHLSRYVNEFSGRHNVRPLDTITQMSMVVRGLVGKRLRYEELIG